MEPKQQKDANVSEKPIDKQEISKEVSEFMVKQMKYDRKDIRHKITYITDKSEADKPFIF